MSAGRRLAQCSDGAILVTGLFASAFLIGVLWYLLGVGDAFLFRQRTQDGADAVAFATSVVHARGMNLIALLNLTMAAVLALFVAVKIVQALLLVANILGCLVCAGSFGAYCEDCDLLSSQEGPYGDFVSRVDRDVSEINSSLYDTANTVARDMPLLAAHHGVDASGSYARMVEGAFAASLALVPGEDASGDLTDDPGEASDRTRYGLPVEDDDYRNLCVHSGTLAEIVFVPTLMHFDEGDQLVVSTMKYAFALVGALVGMDANSWCSGESSTPGGLIFTPATCLRGMSPFPNLQCLNGLRSGAFGLGSSSGIGKEHKVSKRIYGPARHGDDYFAAWGFSESHFVEQNRRGEKGTEVATWGHAPAGSALPDGELDRRLRTVQIAKSEFYYDPRRGGPRSWGDLKDESMFNPRWRARLRRVTQPNRALADVFAGAGLSSIVEANVGSRADVVGIVETVLAAPPAELAGWAERHVGPVEKSRRTGGIIH